MRRNGRSLAQQVADLKMYPQKMVNVALEPGVQWQKHAGLMAAQKQVERELNGRGRVLIRASGTEPKLRLMVEAEDACLRSEEHTSELQSLMRISYAVFCLKKNIKNLKRKP